MRASRRESIKVFSDKVANPSEVMGVEEKPVSDFDQFLTSDPVSVVLTNSLDKLGTQPAVHGQAEAGQGGLHPPGQVLLPVPHKGAINKMSMAESLLNILPWKRK